MKTIEEFLKYLKDKENKTARHYDLLDIEDYVQQQVSIAVEKALEVAADNAEITTVANPDYDGCFTSTSCSCIKYIEVIDKQSILSLAPQILEELKGGEA